MSIRMWDEKIRQICDLDYGITVWIVPLHHYTKPDYKRVRSGTAIAVFHGESLESAITDYGNQVNGRIFRYAMHDARYYRRQLIKNRQAKL